jgi:tryptophan synthase beta chain
VVLFALSGHGHFDLAAYDTYLSGNLQDYEHPGREIEEAMAAIPNQ